MQYIQPMSNQVHRNSCMFLISLETSQLGFKRQRLQVWSVYPAFNVRRDDKTIRWTPNSSSSPVQDVGTDHRCFHITVAQQLLHGSDIVAILEQVRGKRMPEGMTTGRLRDSSLKSSGLDSPLQDRLMQMVSALFSSLGGRNRDRPLLG